MESNKIQASGGIKEQRSRKTQIHKMHPVFIDFYHFLVEIILFTYNGDKNFMKTFKHLRLFICPLF